MKRVLVLMLAVVSLGCKQDGGVGTTFDSDIAFLRQHTPLVVLSDADKQAQVAIAPAYQGRVMTSTADGGSGQSFGWINRELIASGKTQPHINVFGGEDRFWLGPEGGPFSIFFEKGKAQTLENWYTPAAIDTEPFAVASQDARKATFTRQMKLKNASGTSFDVGVERTVSLIDPKEACSLLGVNQSEDVKLVAYQSSNKITNAGKEAWKKETGLLSVWILGMFNPSDTTTVVVPFKGERSKVVNDSYFGKVPADRLKARSDYAGMFQGPLFFKGDGKYRSKIGVSPQGAMSVLGSYDSASRTLTIVQYNLPGDAPSLAYVNSTWGEQKDPYAGDAVNSYNDGPPEPGKKPLGPFYELETSSPAAALKPGESLTHVHRTMHFTGDEAALDAIATKVLGAGVKEISTALP